MGFGVWGLKFGVWGSGFGVQGFNFRSSDLPSAHGPHGGVANVVVQDCSLMRNTPLLGPYSRTVLRVLWWSWRGGLFLMSEVPL